MDIKFFINITLKKLYWQFSLFQHKKCFLINLELLIPTSGNALVIPSSAGKRSAIVPMSSKENLSVLKPWLFPAGHPLQEPNQGDKWHSLFFLGGLLPQAAHYQGFLPRNIPQLKWKWWDREKGPYRNVTDDKWCLSAFKIHEIVRKSNTHPKPRYLQPCLRNPANDRRQVCPNSSWHFPVGTHPPTTTFLPTKPLQK